MSGPPNPFAVGPRDDPEIDALLRDFDDELAGSHIKYTTAWELWNMPKAPGRPVAVPPEDYWPRMIRTLVEVWMPARTEYAAPIYLRGYRPPDYNDAVGGEPFDEDSRGSAHMYFEAIDMYTVDRSTEARRRLALIVARIYRARGAELAMGFGAYGFPSPNDLHVDTGWRRRTWRDARKFVRAA